jgi:hypothetical protein
MLGNPLREACSFTAHALAAPIARIIALTAPKMLRFSGTPFHGRGAADYSEALIDVIVDRQGSDAGIGRCGTANSPAQMGGESEYLSDAVCLARHAIST